MVGGFKRHRGRADDGTVHAARAGGLQPGSSVLHNQAVCRGKPHHGGSLGKDLRVRLGMSDHRAVTHSIKVAVRVEPFQDVGRVFAGRTNSQLQPRVVQRRQGVAHGSGHIGGRHLRQQLAVAVIFLGGKAFLFRIGKGLAAAGKDDFQTLHPADAAQLHVDGFVKRCADFLSRLFPRFKMETVCGAEHSIQVENNTLVFHRKFLIVTRRPALPGDRPR